MLPRLTMSEQENSLRCDYVPGCGYVDSSGDNTVINGQDIYENGNKIGEMGGGN